MQLAISVSQLTCYSLNTGVDALYWDTLESISIDAFFNG